jgi:hypothetical protein
MILHYRGDACEHPRMLGNPPSVVWFVTQHTARGWHIELEIEAAAFKRMVRPFPGSWVANCASSQSIIE